MFQFRNASTKHGQLTRRPRARWRSLPSRSCASPRAATRLWAQTAGRPSVTRREGTTPPSLRHVALRTTTLPARHARHTNQINSVTHNMPEAATPSYTVSFKSNTHPPGLVDMLGHPVGLEMRERAAHSLRQRGRTTTVDQQIPSCKPWMAVLASRSRHEPWQCHSDAQATTSVALPRHRLARTQRRRVGTALPTPRATAPAPPRPRPRVASTACRAPAAAQAAPVSRTPSGRR